MNISQYTPLEMRDKTVLNLHIVDKGHPVWLVITHGVCEHLERYDEIAHRYEDSFNILRYDLRGHGRSEGKSHSIDQFDDFSKDLAEILQFLHHRYDMHHYVLFGHSMGGLIVSSFIQKILNELSHDGVRDKTLDDNYEEIKHKKTSNSCCSFLKRIESSHLKIKLEMVFLSSPCIAPANFLVSAARILPGLFNLKTLKGVSPIGYIRESLLSHATKIDPIYKDLHTQDLSISLKLMLAIALNSKRVFSKHIKMGCPTNAVIGTMDSIVSVSAFKKYFEKYSNNTNVLYIDGGFHELMHELPIYKVPYFEFLDKCLDDVVVRNLSSKE